MKKTLRKYIIYTTVIAYTILDVIIWFWLLILETKNIHFKVIDNDNINTIMNEKGTLYVEVYLSCEKSKTLTPFYWGYYTMKWSATSQSEAYLIADKTRSKLLSILSDSYYSEEDAFHLKEEYVYDFSDIERLSISTIIAKP